MVCGRSIERRYRQLWSQWMQRMNGVHEQARWMFYSLCEIATVTPLLFHYLFHCCCVCTSFVLFSSVQLQTVDFEQRILIQNHTKCHVSICLLKIHTTYNCNYFVQSIVKISRGFNRDKTGLTNDHFKWCFILYDVPVALSLLIITIYWSR